MVLSERAKTRTALCRAHCAVDVDGNVCIEVNVRNVFSDYAGFTETLANTCTGYVSEGGRGWNTQSKNVVACM